MGCGTGTSTSRLLCIAPNIFLFVGHKGELHLPKPFIFVATRKIININITASGKSKNNVPHNSPDDQDGSIEVFPDVGSVLVGLHHDHGPVVDALGREAVAEQRHVLVNAPRADACAGQDRDNITISVYLSAGTKINEANTFSILLKRFLHQKIL